MIKKILLAAVAMTAAAGLSAQEADNVQYRTEGDNIIVTYDLSAPAHITLFLSEKGGDWTILDKVSGDVGPGVDAGQRSITWDVFAERPKGITGNERFLVKPNWREPSMDNLPNGWSAYGTVINGTKAYTVYKSNYTAHYAGDFRKGTWASATDNITFDAYLKEYDYMTGKTRDIFIEHWTGRVARKDSSMGDKIPSYRLSVDKKGNLRLDGKQVF